VRSIDRGGEILARTTDIADAVGTALTVPLTHADVATGTVSFEAR
jgi:hypothetical protein